MTSTVAQDRSTASCTPEQRITRSLLGYGILAGPFYLVVSLTQALTRDGFDLTRHEWSLLANGRLGWLQISNLILTGVMCVAFALGVRRALTGRGATWTPRLIATYGVGLIAAGIFRADPALGFPPGTPDGATAVSWHGLLHFVAAAIGFVAMIVATFVLARRFAAAGERGWAVYSRVTGIAFLAGFVAVAAGGGSVTGNLLFTAAIVALWAWLTALAVHLYRS